MYNLRKLMDIFKIDPNENGVYFILIPRESGDKVVAVALIYR